MRAARLMLCLMLMPFFVLSCRERVPPSAPAATPTAPSVSPTSQQAIAGATPTPLEATLASTPVASATPTEYCDLVCQDATATAKITPGVPQLPSEEYLEQERQYLVLLTRVAAYTRTPTPTRAPTPTLILADRPGYLIYEGLGYITPSSGRPTYRVTYSLAQWRVEGDRLKQQQIRDCILDLWGLAGELLPPVEVKTVMLGEFAWKRAFAPREASIHYGLDMRPDYYLLVLYLPKDVAAAEVQQCQAAAEEVIATFELIGSP